MQRTTIPVYWPRAYSFDAGSAHIARARMRNPGSESHSYQAELYLGTDPQNKAASTVASFSLSPDEEKDVDFPVAMPVTAGTYHIYLDVYVGDELIAAYMSTEDVTVSELILPDINLISAVWDKDTYLPGEYATLTAKFKNPTTLSSTYDTTLRLIVNNMYVIRVDQTFTLGAGEETQIFYTCVAPDSTYPMYIDVFSGGELIKQYRVPDLVVSIPTPEPAFIMLGGIFVDTTWPKDADTYTKTGTLKNVGQAAGTTTVVGWIKVHGVEEIHDLYEETITLGPGESRAIAYTITRQQAQAAGADVQHPILMAYISTDDHARYGTPQGEKYTQDTVYCKWVRVCEEGETKCEGTTLFTCHNNQWFVTERNSPACGYVPPTTGELEITVIDGSMYYMSGVTVRLQTPTQGEISKVTGSWGTVRFTDVELRYDSEWCLVSVEMNGYERWRPLVQLKRGYTQTRKFQLCPLNCKCVGSNLYQYVDGQWLLLQEGSPLCFMGANYKCVGGDLYERCAGAWGGWWMVVENSHLCV